MKYVKMLGLLAVAAAALMAFAGSASATTLTSSTGATPTIHATSTNPVLTGPFTEVICAHSTVHGTVTSHGAGVTASGPLTPKTGLTFTGCSHPVTVINPGTLEVHAATPTGNGTVTSKNAVVEVHTSVGVCRIETGAAGTHIGSLTGSNNLGGKAAVLDITTTLPFNGTSFFCGGSGTWHATYTVNHPVPLEVH